VAADFRKPEDIRSWPQAQQASPVTGWISPAADLLSARWAANWEFGRERLMVSTQGAERGLKRFEGFTDAVFAIALTLLFVETKPPGSPDGPPAAVDAARAVAEQWPDHLALIVSFLGIGIYWLQHHYSGRLYTKSDHVFSLINLGFLFGIMALPYPVRLWAFHLGGPGEGQASAILAAALLLPSLFWILKWLYASPHRRLIDRRLAPDYVSQMTRRYVVGAAVLALAALIALAAPRFGLALSFAATAYWILPQPRPRYRPGEEPGEPERTSD
jgi:uncharacterized membrane protein